MYAVLIALVIICEIVAAVLVLNVYRDEIGEKAQRFMETTIREDYKISSNQEGKYHAKNLLRGKAKSFSENSLLCEYTCKTCGKRGM